MLILLGPREKPRRYGCIRLGHQDGPHKHYRNSFIFTFILRTACFLHAHATIDWTIDEQNFMYQHITDMGYIRKSNRPSLGTLQLTQCCKFESASKLNS